MLRLACKDLELVELDSYHQCVKVQLIDSSRLLIGDGSAVTLQAELDSVLTLSRTPFLDPKIASVMLVWP